VFVVGHSLGAGIATLAGCYFLTEFDWRDLPHTLINVTAGSPRAACESMKVMIDQRRALMGSSNARLYRVVKGDDVVTRVPPHTFGFRHLVDPVVISDFGGVQFPKERKNEVENDKDASDLLEDGLKEVSADSAAHLVCADMEHNLEIMMEETSYERMVAHIPKALRDHMPDFYLKPLFKARGLRHGTVRECVSQDTEAREEPAEPAREEKPETPGASSKQRRKSWVPKMFRPRKESVEPIHW
jgi:Lipase (class 3)